MKKMLSISMLTGFLVLTLLAVPAFAADPAPAAQAFGVVDMNKVMRTSEAARDIFSQLDVKRKEFQESTFKEETALRAVEQEILKRKESLSKEEFDKRRKEFEEKIVGGQKAVQERRRTLETALNRSLGTLRSAAAKIIAEVAGEKGYSAVLTRDAVMISAPSMDITDIVIERMNKSVQKIKIDWAASALPAGGKGK